MGRFDFVMGRFAPPIFLLSSHADGVRLEFRGDPLAEGVGKVGLDWNSVRTGLLAEGVGLSRGQTLRRKVSEKLV